VAVLGAIMLALVGLPLLVLVLSALKRSTALPFDSVPLTLVNLREVFGGAITYQLLARTCLYAAGTIVLGLCLAFLAAWLVERTDVPGRNVIRTLMVLVMGMPGALVAFGWLLLASPRSGAINLWLRGALGLGSATGPFDIYSLMGMIFVTGLAVAPSIFLMISGLLRRLDASLEEAAAAAGASWRTILGRIIAPLLSPGLLSVVLYLTVVLIQYFEVPLAIGLPGNVMVLSIRVYLLARPNPGLPEYGLASAYGCLTLIVAAGLLAAYMRATRRTEAYRTVTGKGFRPKRMRLGKWAGPALVAISLYFALALVLPLGILLWASFLPSYQPPSPAAVRLLSLQSYATALRTAGVGQAAVNTVIVVLVTATATIALSSFVAIVSLRARSRAGRSLEAIAFLPAAIPAVVIALAVMLFSVRTPLYGTVWAIALGQLIAFLAYGSRTMSAAMLQLQLELEEAAVMSGAGWWKTQWRVVLPLLLPAAANGWIWVAAHSMRDFTFPVMLATTGNVLMSSLIWQVWSRPDLSVASAMAIMLVLVLTGCLALARGTLLRLGEA